MTKHFQSVRYLGQWAVRGSRFHALAAALLTAVAVTGCGSQAPESTVVPPPAGEQPAEPTLPSESPAATSLETMTPQPVTPGSAAAGSSAFELPPDSAVPANNPPAPANGNFQLPPDAENGSDPAGDSAATTAPTVQYASWDAIRDAAKTGGKITVVDLWSLSCEPCLKEFPGLVRLHRQYGESVQCMAVNLDFDGRKTRPPQHYQDAVTAFLDSVNADGFPTYICETPSDDVYAAADIDSIPAVLIFDAMGELAKRFVDAGETVGFSYEKDIQPWIQQQVGS